jgi:hypothetical protein
LYEEFAPERRRYDAVVAAYAVERKPAAIRAAASAAHALGYKFITQRVVRESAGAGLREGLLALGYAEDDIHWHIANPGKRDATVIAAAADLPFLLSRHRNERQTGRRGTWRGNYTKRRC